MEKKLYLVTESEEGQRIDKYLKKVLVNAPASFIYKLLRTKDIKVNNKKIGPEYIIHNEDEITIFLTEEQSLGFLASYEFPKVAPTFKVIYEDDNVLVVHKEAGLIVHSSAKEKVRTLANMVLTYLFEKQEFDPEKRGYIPSPVARIDEDTDGIVLFSKKQSVHQLLATAFTTQFDVIRNYRLVVYGILDKDEGIINLPLTKVNGRVVVSSKGQSAVTAYKVLARNHEKTYVEAKLLTGRQHQIRVHFATSGFPLVGDTKYGKAGDTHPFALNAYSLTFNALPFPLEYLNGKIFIADNTKQLERILGE